MTRIRRSHGLFLLVLVSVAGALASDALAAVYGDGRPVGSIEQQRLLGAQKETIALLEDQVAEQKKANELKQRELDGHKYDGLKNVGWIVLTVIITMVVTALCRTHGPVRWWWDGRRLLRIVRNRRFRFVFNPGENRSKTVVFGERGEITEGRNCNEGSWRIRRGALEVLGEDNRLYSRFRFDELTGRLVNTNDPDARSVLGQYFEPQWRRVVADPEA